MIKTIAAVALLLMLGGCWSSGPTAAMHITSIFISGGKLIRNALTDEPVAPTVSPHDDSPVIAQDDSRH